MRSRRVTIVIRMTVWRLAFLLTAGLVVAEEEVRVVGIPAEARWQGLTAGVTGSMFRVAVPGFVMKPSAGGWILSIPRQAAYGKPGEPALPAVAAVCETASKISFSVEMRVPAWIEITNVFVAPVASKVLDDVTTNAPTYSEKRTPSPARYGSDRFWPDVAAVTEEAWAGTGKLVRVECVPFQYNPVRRILRYAPVMEGRLVPSKNERTK